MSAGDTYILLPGIEYTETVNVGIVVSLFEGRLSPFQHGVMNVSSKKALLGPHSSRVISFDLFMVDVYKRQGGDSLHPFLQLCQYRKYGYIRVFLPDTVDNLLDIIFIFNFFKFANFHRCLVIYRLLLFSK